MIFYGIIYKITNLVNGKIYIGQTTNQLGRRWQSHCDAKYNNSKISKAIQKYGKENFRIRTIDGATNITELNYKEWLLIHKFNALEDSVGYNMKEGGKGSWLTPEQIEKKKKYHPMFIPKAVIDVKTGKIWPNLMKCSKDLGFVYENLKSQLNGNNANYTSLRYLGQERLSREPKEKIPHNAVKVINIKTGKIWISISNCAKEIGVSSSQLSAKLLAKNHNNTDIRILGKEHIFKPKTLKQVGQSKKVINIDTNEVWESAKDAYDANKPICAYSSFKNKLNGSLPNKTPFRYVGQEKVCKKYTLAKPIVNTETGQKFKTIADCERFYGLKKAFLKDRMRGQCKHDEFTSKFKFIQE